MNIISYVSINEWLKYLGVNKSFISTIILALAIEAFIISIYETIVDPIINKIFPDFADKLTINGVDIDFKLGKIMDVSIHSIITIPLAYMLIH